MYVPGPVLGVGTIEKNKKRNVALSCSQTQVGRPTGLTEGHTSGASVESLWEQREGKLKRRGALITVTPLRGGGRHHD